MDSDSLSPSPPRSEPNEVNIPHEQIRRTMTIVLNVFAVHPVHAYHPGRHIALKEAVPVLSALNRSHGLTEDQVEGLGRLLRDWDRIINDAVEASDAKKKAAAQQLSPCNEVALILQSTQSKKQLLEGKIKKVGDADLRKDYAVLIGLLANIVSEMSKLKGSLRDTNLKQQMEKAEELFEKANQECRALEMLQLLEGKIKVVVDADVRKEYACLIGLLADIVSEMAKLKQSFRNTNLMAPTLKEQVEKAEESLEKANQEWKALEMLLRGINSSLLLE